jgi:hypothetical protein
VRQLRNLKGPSCTFRSGLGPAHPRDEITSVRVLNGASTALARNALREAGAPVFLALRYRAAHRPTCREAHVLCLEGARSAPATPDILVLAEEGGRLQLRVSQGSGFECRAALGAVRARSAKCPFGCCLRYASNSSRRLLSLTEFQKARSSGFLETLSTAPSWSSRLVSRPRPPVGYGQIPIVPLPLRPPPLKRHRGAAAVMTVSDGRDRLRTAAVGHSKSSTSLSRIACDASKQSMKHSSTLV